MAKRKDTWREKKQKKRLKKQEKALKEKLNEEKQEAHHTESEEEIDNEEISDVSTISIAVPGSILENAQSQELRTYLAGQIARAGEFEKLLIILKIQ